ncbi:hypothetical protein [Salinicoccus albus]|uniref:hypothetical protein n=1 Tax=Salinicoccus albus TaxID=418756 RepID=UPI00036AA68E|nr:hypothetical protein [Salinicoccus albus]
MLSMAFRKVYLQWLQVKHVKEGSNRERTELQKEVLRYLLTHPGKLVSSERVNYPKNYAKYLNVLTSNVKNDRLYEISKKRLKSV